MNRRLPRVVVACAVACCGFGVLALGDEPQEVKPDETKTVESGAGASEANAASKAVRARSWAMTLLLNDGSTEPIDLTGLNVGAGVREGAITYIDRTGKVAKRPSGEVLAVVPEWWTIAGVSPGPMSERAIGQSVLDLNDGQRLVGRLVTTEPSGSLSGERVEWMTQRFGRFSVPLDHLAAWSSRGMFVGGQSITADRVRLSNGDVLEGVIDGIDKMVTLAPATPRGAKSAMIPIENIESLVLANPERALGGVYAWLNDGSVVRLSRVQFDNDGKVGLVAANSAEANSQVTLRTSDVVAIATDYSRVRPLGSLDFGNPSAAGGLVYAASASASLQDGDAAPVLGAADVLLPAPMVIEAELPEGAQVFSGLAEMPESSLTWGDCELVISVVSPGGKAREVERQRLSAARSSVPLNLKLDAKPKERLRLAVEAGARGPVQDRVLIRHGVLVIEPRKAAR